MTKAENPHEANKEDQLPKERQLSTGLTISLSQWLKDRLKARAKLAKQSVSAFVADRMHEFLCGDLKTAEQCTQLEKEKHEEELQRIADDLANAQKVEELERRTERAEHRAKKYASKSAQTKKALEESEKELERILRKSKRHQAESEKDYEIQRLNSELGSAKSERDQYIGEVSAKKREISEYRDQLKKLRRENRKLQNRIDKANRSL